MNTHDSRPLPRLRRLLPGLALGLCAVLAMSATATAADSGATQIAALQAAMAGDDAGAKKTAIRALASKDVGKDDQVIPLLIGAISDRQAGEAAVGALSSRIGKTPKDGAWKNNQELTTQAWQSWYDDWKKTQAIKKIEKKEAKIEQEIAKPTVAPPAPTTPAEGERSLPPTPAEDLGKIDRVIFKAGGSLLCYIMSKRTDSEGNLLSVRIVHPDGAGEETITASLIARIEEDITNQ